jgi:ribose transport system permease protein
MKRLWGLLAVNVVFVVLASIGVPHFLTSMNLNALVTNMALEMIILGPLALLLIGGFFDISLDGVVALSGVLAGVLMNSGVHPLIACLIALTVAGCFGFLNGWGVSRWKLNPLVLTMATWWIAAGTATGISGGLTPYGFPEGFQVIGQSELLGIRLPVLYGLVAIILFQFMLSRTRFGARVYVTGDNPEAARMMGIRTGNVTLALYIASGIMAGFIGLVLAARLNAGSANAVDGMTLRVIAAAVIGGCALSGGQGNIVNGLLGLLLMDMFANATTLLGVNAYWQRAIVGGVLFMSVFIDQVGSKWWQSRRAIWNKGEQ